MEKVGLDRFLKYSKLTQNKERAREEIVAFIKKEKITNCLDYKRLAKMKGLPSLAFIRKEYGGWETLLNTIGLRRKLTKEMIVKAIRNYHEKNGKSPAAAILAKKLKTTVDSITGITGNYNSLLNELDLPLNKQLYERNKLSKDQLKQLYIEFSRKNSFLNGAPRLVLNKFTDVPNASVFIRRFGSMSDLRRVCGFIPFNEYNGYSRKEIIELLRKKYLSLRRSLKTEEINDDKDLLAVSTILRYLELPTLEEVWKFIKNDIQGIG